MRAIAVIAGIVAIMTVLAEALAAGLLWSQGRLSTDSVREIRAILRESPEDFEEDTSKNQTHAVSVEDVIAARSIRVLQLEEREQEQQLLKALVADSRETVLKEQGFVKSERDAFLKMQEEVTTKENSASIEQARNVLLKADIATAVDQLMVLTEEECVTLVKGMPEKKIAELLAAFAAGDKPQAQRGQEIFQAIARARTSPPTTTEEQQ